MDLRKLKTILELFEGSNLEEIEFCEGEAKIRLKKPTASVAAASPPAGVGVPVVDSEEAPAAAVENDTRTIVKSPMVGTFYRSASPEKPPFVRVGQRVEAGNTLCIIEAMKLMNEIPSPVSGVVKEILVENEEPVAYGAGLFIVE